MPFADTSIADVAYSFTGEGAPRTLVLFLDSQSAVGIRAWGADMEALPVFGNPVFFSRTEMVPIERV